MRSISVANPSIANVYKTYLTAAYVSGISLSVVSNVSFSANDFVVIGEPSEESTELQRISALSGKETLTLIAALNFEHTRSSPVYRVNWNYVIIEGRALSTDVWARLTESPIQWDKLNTVYNHVAGTNTWQYRHRFWDSFNDRLSEYGPTILGSGFTRSQVGYMLRQVRQVTNDLNGRVAGDRAIIRFFNSAQDIIRGYKADWSWLKVTDTSITTTASINKYGLPANIGNLGNVEDVRYRYDDGAANDITYQLKFKNEKEFDALVEDNERSTDDYVKVYTFSEADSSNASGYILVEPIPKTTARGTFYIRYHREMADLDTVDDETLVPIPSLLENFAIGQMEWIKDNEDKARLYERWLVSDNDKVIPKGIAMLFKLDAAKRRPSGQPFSLKRWRGRRGANQFYNRGYINADYQRETYF